MQCRGQKAFDDLQHVLAVAQRSSKCDLVMKALAGYYQIQFSTDPMVLISFRIGQFSEA